MSQSEIAYCLEQVKMNGLFIQHIEDPTEEICMAAVTKSPWALQYISEQT